MFKKFFHLDVFKNYKITKFKNYISILLQQGHCPYP